MMNRIMIRKKINNNNKTKSENANYKNDNKFDIKVISSFDFTSSINLGKKTKRGSSVQQKSKIKRIIILKGFGIFLMNMLIVILIVMMNLLKFL